MKHAVKEVLRQAAAQGWQVQPTRSGHVRLVHPAGTVVVTSSTPSDCRALANLKAQLRRAARRATT
jgi:predicted RNA binding protein YcfA (HicA-like mRNA interferase family)